MDPSHLRMLVLDEADALLAGSFLAHADKLLGSVDRSRVVRARETTLPTQLHRAVTHCTSGPAWLPAQDGKLAGHTSAQRRLASMVSMLTSQSHAAPAGSACH